jgi:hypothetical protein
MSTLTPTEPIIRRIIELVGYGLPSGLGRQEPGQMCVEACVNAAFGLDHGDNPPCVHPAVREAKIALNDSPWSDNQARGKGMLKLAVAQVGSENIDGEKFVRILFEGLPGLKKRHPARNDAEAVHHTAEAACYTAEAARYTACAAHYTACAAHLTARASNDTDACLLDFAEIMLDALKQCDAPGMKWLALLDENKTA